MPPVSVFIRVCGENDICCFKVVAFTTFQKSVMHLRQGHRDISVFVCIRTGDGFASETADRRGKRYRLPILQQWCAHLWPQ